MIDRYSNKDIREIWSDRGKYTRWAWLELLWIAALAEEHGDKRIHSNYIEHVVEEVATTEFSEKVAQAEMTTKHDVRAFLEAFSEVISFDIRQWLHAGLTSSDLVDSGEAIARWKSFVIVGNELRKLRAELDKLEEWGSGRLVMEYTHGQPSEVGWVDEGVSRWGQEVDMGAGSALRVPISLKWGGPIGGEFSGALNRFKQSLLRSRRGFVAHVMELFPGTHVELHKNCSQTVSRADIASEVFLLWRISSGLAKIAQDLRFWHLRGYLRSSEDCSSSVMAGKSNPAALEKVQGLERMLQGFVVAQMSNALIWENRDMTHSGVDRLTIPDAFEVVAHQAATLTKYLSSSSLDGEAMAEDLHEESRYTRMLQLQLEEGKEYTQAWKQVCQE